MPQSRPPAKPFRIGLLLYPQCMPAGLFAFADLMHGANRRSGQALLQPVFVAQQAGAVTCGHGQVLQAEARIDDAGLDALLVPGFWGESSQDVAATLAANAALVAALGRLPKTLQVWSYCTGVCLAAAAGRLKGGAATVTWWLADAMRRQYPMVAWQTEQTCVMTAQGATASGVNGYLPIAQAFLEQRISKDAYRDLTKLMVLPRPEPAHHVFQTLSIMDLPDPLLRKLHKAAERMPAEEATVSRLAQKLHMTQRTLARKVAAGTGMAIAGYVRRIKLNQVSERLIHTSVPASAISAELGFSSDAGMRRMFKELTGLTPTQYRQAFGRK